MIIYNSKLKVRFVRLQIFNEDLLLYKTCLFRTIFPFTGGAIFFISEFLKFVMENSSFCILIPVRPKYLNFPIRFYDQNLYYSPLIFLYPVSK